MKLLWLLPFLLVLTVGFGYTENKILKIRTPGLCSMLFHDKTATASLTIDQVQGSEEADTLYLANKKNKYNGTVLTNGTGKKREVALTFDDAPDATFTPKILNILKNKGVKATFFVVGWRIEAYPDVVRRILRDGHVIGNHTYSHAHLLKLDDNAFHEQILKTDRLIEKYTGFTPTLVRPPYGLISDSEVKWLLAQHRQIVNWNVDSLDWKGISSDQVAKNVLIHVHPGSIILQHSGIGTGGNLSGTVNALPKIIDELRKEGYNLVTLPELLDSTK